MNNFTVAVQEYGQNRAPNTLQLRAEYNRYVIAQQESGQPYMGFEEWAKVNYPEKKILNQNTQPTTQENYNGL